jgi:tripartite-type tricarboxylate transporter receptor subunit TctC
MPDVPTLEEAVGHEVPITVWFGLVGPLNMPKDVLEIFSGAVQKATSDPALVAAWEKMQFSSDYLAPAAFAKKIAQDEMIYKNVLKEMGTIK